MSEKNEAWWKKLENASFSKRSLKHKSTSVHAYNKNNNEIINNDANIDIKESKRQCLLEKTRLCLWISRSIDEKLRSLIQQKYGNYEKGLLSYEVEMAFRYWLALHTNTQSQILRNRPNPTPKVMIVFSQVKDYLLHNYYFELLPGQQVPTKHLEEAVTAIRGCDQRTIMKWLKTFHKMGLIKPVTSATWEIL